MGAASCDQVEDKIYFVNAEKGLERKQDNELITWKQLKESGAIYYAADEKTWEYIANKCKAIPDDSRSNFNIWFFDLLAKTREGE